MKNFKVLALALVIAAFGGNAMAEDAGTKTSYTNKKQGRVAFVEAEDATASVEAIDPSMIEPAAGEMQDTTSVSGSIKLPRK
ncbi:MAG: hypothetical protein KTR28_05845 [Micavibrio sp.]|nr:hypothetical protein [Micavibrio sp.]